MEEREKGVVFCGPSISHKEAQSIICARVMPPIKRNDLSQLASSGTRLSYIAIIDGCFLQHLAVSPKEILRVLEMGIPVFGASSIGAIRAVELAPYGMIGVGDVYRLYRDMVIDEDDEVALVFDSETLEPLCIPSVNIRLAAYSFHTRGAISDKELNAIIAAAKEIYFPYRSMESVFNCELIKCALGETRSAELKKLFQSAPDYKHDDAKLMLKAIANSFEKAKPTRKGA